jgi:hypothetical protein
MIDRSDLSEDEKEEQKQADLATILIERDKLQRRCEELERTLSAERTQRTISQLRVPVVPGKRNWS